MCTRRGDNNFIGFLPSSALTAAVDYAEQAERPPLDRIATGSGRQTPLLVKRSLFA
jgi:hypothetical protein